MSHTLRRKSHLLKCDTARTFCKSATANTPYAWRVMSHIWMSRATLKTLWRTRQNAQLETFAKSATANTPYAWRVMSHIWMSHVALKTLSHRTHNECTVRVLRKKSCQTYERVMSHLRHCHTIGADFRENLAAVVSSNFHKRHEWFYCQKLYGSSKCHELYGLSAVAGRCVV